MHLGDLLKRAESGLSKPRRGATLERPDANDVRRDEPATNLYGQWMIAGRCVDNV